MTSVKESVQTIFYIKYWKLMLVIEMWKPWVSKNILYEMWFKMDD